MFTNFKSADDEEENENDCVDNVVDGWGIFDGCEEVPEICEFTVDETEDVSDSLEDVPAVLDVPIVTDGAGEVERVEEVCVANVDEDCIEVEGSGISDDVVVVAGIVLGVVEDSGNDWLLDTTNTLVSDDTEVRDVQVWLPTSPRILLASEEATFVNNDPKDKDDCSLSRDKTGIAELLIADNVDGESDDNGVVVVIIEELDWVPLVAWRLTCLGK